MEIIIGLYPMDLRSYLNVGSKREIEWSYKPFESVVSTPLSFFNFGEQGVKMTKRRTEKDMIEIVEKFDYKYINHYYVSKSQTKVIIQDRNGYKYDVHLRGLLSGQGISFVDKSNPFSLENISLWLKLNNSQFELLENNEYKDAKSRLNLFCKICKDYPTMNWSNIMQRFGCGVCNGKQVGLYHNLAIQRPDIAKEWHPSKNGSLAPEDVSYGSGKKVWWVCKNGHNYFSSIDNRTCSGESCNVCSDSQKESKIATEIKDYIINKYHAKEEYKIVRNPETNRFLSFDVYIFGGENSKINGIYIEIHGIQHYKKTYWNDGEAERKGITPEEEFKYRESLDNIKRIFAKKNGVYVEVDLRKIKNTEQAIELIEECVGENYG